jgi:mannosyl-3-phosphoglycerate phosphatase
MNLRLHCIVFSDVHSSSLGPDGAPSNALRAAVDMLREYNIPLVFCTSQTRAEVQALRRALGNQDPFIVENGAAILIPRGYFGFSIPGSTRNGGYEQLELGRAYAELTAVLRRSSAVTGCEVRAFHQLSAEEIAEHCGLTIEAARRAKAREWDEPFEVTSRSSALAHALFDGLEKAGLTWARGVRFYHVRGRHNKGQAAEVLIDLYRYLHGSVQTVGIGDGPNDISLLRLVDRAVVIPANGHDRAHLASRPWPELVTELFEPSAAVRPIDDQSRLYVREPTGSRRP